MYMNNELEILTVSKEREDKIKQKYGYTDLYVVDPSFLAGTRKKIIGLFEDVNVANKLLSNMSRISEVYIGNNSKKGPIFSTSESIHVDLSLVTISENSIFFNQELEDKFIYHLLHSASRGNGTERSLTGIVENEKDENGKTVGKKYVGLNNGIAKYLASDISGKQTAEDDKLFFNEGVVSLLADTLGKDIIMTSFFGRSIDGNTNALKNMMNSLANDPDFFDKFNKDLDMINRLETTLRKLKNGEIKSEDPRSIEVIETVLTAQKEALVENLFSNIILPQIQTKQTEQERQQMLLPLLLKHEKVLSPVAKYISKHDKSVWVTDQIIEAIKNEIKTDGIDFNKMMELSRKTKDSFNFGKVTAKRIVGDVVDFYEENKDKLTENKSTKLTPLLERQLVRMVEVLDQLELRANEVGTRELKQSVESFKNFLKKHFHKISNLDEEMERIRQEKRQKKPTGTTSQEDPEVSDILDRARRAGAAAANDDAHSNNERAEEQHEEQEQNRNTRKPTLRDDFIIDNLTGEVIDQRSASIYERVRNITKATGDCDYLNDPEIAGKRQKSAMNFKQNFIENMLGSEKKRLKKMYGKDWEKVLLKAFEDGYNQAMEGHLENAKMQGNTIREENKTIIENGGQPLENSFDVTLDKLKFAYENFDIRTKEDGQIEIVDRVTEQVVTSERTKNMVLFAQEWVRATGSVNKEGTIEVIPSLAFSKESIDIYRFMQAQAKKDLNNNGAFNMSDLEINAEAMGPRFQMASQVLFRNQDTADLIDSHFRMQNPNSKPNPVPQTANEEQKTTGSHK